MNEALFDRVLKEHFDTSDRRSMKIMLSLNEADQNQAMAALASKLYKKIIDKVDDIDFGTIPASKGDITKIGNYIEMMECIDIINDLVVNFKQNASQINTVKQAVTYMNDSKKIWEKGFAVNSELAITFYNTICLSIVDSVSLLISSSIDFISTPNDGVKTFSISFDNVGYSKTKDKLLFQNLEKFNSAYAKGDIEKIMTQVVKTTGNLKESTTIPDAVNESDILASIVIGIGGAIFIGGIISLIVPILHELVSFFYCTKQSTSEYFEIQAKLIQLNAEQLKYEYTKSEGEIKKIYDKQMKIAATFRKISDALSIKINKADKIARQEVQNDKKEKYKVDDLETKDIPAMTSSSIF